MELLEVFYRRKLRKKEKKLKLGYSDGALCRSPSEANVNSLATGLISRVLRFTSRRSEPASRPHSWHSTKICEAQQEIDEGGMDTMISAWPHSIHSRFDSTGGYLRKSPDQYSSRGSMDSLDHPQPSPLHSVVQHQHPLENHSNTGSHPAYSSCHQLSSARSSNSIDHPHNKRDSAYSSFSNSSSIPDYHVPTTSFSAERSYSLETVPQRGRGSVGGVCYHGTNSGKMSGSSNRATVASNRHSVGPIWGPTASHSSYENLKGPPAPPRRSDSYIAIRNHERPNSWSSLENVRSLRSLQKGSWHHSSGPVAFAKGSYGIEGQLHTVIEKSPESSPTTKPRQGGGFNQPPLPSLHSSRPASPNHQPSCLTLPATMYPVPQPEHHYVYSLIPGPSGVYPALDKDKDNRCQNLQRLQCVSNTNEGVMEGQNDERLFTIESNQQNTIFSPYTHSSYSTYSSTQPGIQSHEADRREKQDCNIGSCRPHIKTNRGKLDGHTEAKRPQNHQGLYSQSFEGFHSTKNLGLYQEQNQQLSITNIHSSINFRSTSTQEMNDHHMPVQPWGNRSSDPAAPQYQDWNQRDQEKDRENPLTRLEIALAEVQGCTSPDHVSSARNHENINFSDGSHGPTRTLSVLEKVSCFEHRERSEKQQSQNTSNKSIHPQTTEKSHNVPSGGEDLRNIIKRGSKGTKAHKTMKNRGGGSEYMKHRTLENPSFALQRSISSFQLNVSRTEGNSKEAPWRRDVQEIKVPLQDMSSNRQKNLKSLISSSLSATPSTVSFPSSHQPSTALTKYLSLEKKAPQTMPKPQGIVIKQQSLMSVTSPHTPKERHEIIPDVRGPSSPALPSVPPVEPSPLIRVCGRKRLTADQRKCSYSEPENINEVGVSSADTAALFWFGRETSVADRRKMFELAVSHEGGRETISRPRLRQIKQDTLTEYAEKKREVMKEKEEQRSESRPPCANQQPVHSTHTGRVTTQELPAHPVPSGSIHGFHAQIHQNLTRCSGQISRQTLSHQHHQQAVEPHQSLELSKELSGVLQRAVLSQKSASAEDLLENSEDRLTFPHHLRSHSSPTADTLNENFHPGNVKMVGVTSSEPVGCAVAADRAEDVHISGELVSPQPSQWTNSITQLGQPSKDHCHTPVTRRERQRNNECQRAHSTSTLAASVGLPSNFTPLMTKDSATEWKANERLSQANLDAITFPDIPQTSTADGDSSKGAAVGTTGNVKTLMSGTSLSLSLSGTRKTEDTKKDIYRSQDVSLKITGRHSPENGKLVSTVTTALLPHCKLNSPNGKAHERTPSSPLPSSHSSVHQNMPSLSISESSLLGFINQQQPLETVTRIPQEDFLQNHNCNPTLLPHIPAQQINEINTAEDLPPHLLPLELKQETQQRRPSQKPQLSSVTSGTSFANADNLGFEYRLLPKREKTLEELRVEELTHQLDLQDSSLAFFMDTCGGKSIIDLMGEIFPNSGVSGNSDQQCRGSPHTDSRIQHRDCSLAQIVVTDQGREINRDEEERVLNNRKVELCEALRKSVAALQREKQELCDKQKSHQALGDSIDMLVQERLKTNERDKYNMFIGDLEKIVNLLMSLCSRLARIDRCLLALDKHELMLEDAKEERDSLNHKRSLLLRQTEDARELKENLDRRQRVVNTILSSYLTEEQLQDYCHFVSTKSSLLIRQRHVDELIRQGGEQLTRLAESLPAEVAEAHSWLTAYRLSNPTLHSSLITSLVPPSVIPGSAHLFRSTSVTLL